MSVSNESLPNDSLPNPAVRVLVVEDDPDLSKLICERLVESGYETATAATGLESLHWLAEHRADLMLLDYYLPDMLCDELLDYMQQRGTVPPFIVATGNGAEAVALEMMQRGARDYLIKDATFLRLLPAVVEQTVKQVRQEERLQSIEAQLRASEEELRLAHSELESRVREQTAEIAAANVRLRVAVDDRRRAEDQARQQQGDLTHVARLSTLGEMVAVLTHELNQPLTAIANYAEACLALLHKAGTPRETLADSLDGIRQQATRAAEIVRRVRPYCDKSSPVRAELDLNELVRDVVALVQVEARLSRVEIVIEDGDPLLPVLADRRQIEQVLLNLLRNALDAMREGEVLPRQIAVRMAVRGDLYLEVTVRDRGHGPPQGDPEQMFARFFTTKPHGVGMGLPICRAIIEDHGGQLWYEPASDQGSIFRFTLPLGYGRVA